MKKIYLDYAASTPVAKEVLAAMEPYFSLQYGNASSLHYFGQKATMALDGARESVARLIGANFREIVFTSGATEANNLVLRGVVKGCSIKNPRVIISSVEHDSVIETACDLEKDGVEIVRLPVDKNGKINLDFLKKSLNSRVVLVSVMYANNITGSIHPIVEISKIIKNFKKKSKFPFFHSDAVQALQYLDCDMKKLGVDFMTLSAHKIYGPKGIGLLCSAGKTNQPDDVNGLIGIKAVTTGGGQEFGLRAGTENVPAIVGFAKAMEKAIKIREKEAKRLGKLKESLWEEIKKNAPNAIRNAEDTEVLPNILNVSFPNAPKNLVARFDMLGVAVSSGSACSARSQKASHVLRAMGISEELSHQSIRFSLGIGTTEEEIRKTIQTVRAILHTVS